MFRCTRLFLATTGEISAALAHMGLTMVQAADAKTLRARYLDLTRRNHPDAGGDERTMRDVIEAFRVLGEVTPAERAHYSDDILRQSQKPQPSTPSGYGKGGHNNGQKWYPLRDLENGRRVRATSFWMETLFQICVIIFVGWMMKTQAKRIADRKAKADAAKVEADVLEAKNEHLRWLRGPTPGEKSLS